MPVRSAARSRLRQAVRLLAARLQPLSLAELQTVEAPDILASRVPQAKLAVSQPAPEPAA